MRSRSYLAQSATGGTVSVNRSGVRTGGAGSCPQRRASAFSTTSALATPGARPTLLLRASKSANNDTILLNYKGAQAPAEIRLASSAADEATPRQLSGVSRRRLSLHSDGQVIGARLFWTKPTFSAPVAGVLCSLHSRSSTVNDTPLHGVSPHVLS